MAIVIEHAAIFAADLEKEKDFFVKYFGARPNKIYTESNGFSSYFLTFDGGARLEIMSCPEIEKRTPEDKQTGISHIALSVGDKEKVDSLAKEISADGYRIFLPPRTTGDGYYECCLSDPEGNRIEVTL